MNKQQSKDQSFRRLVLFCVLPVAVRFILQPAPEDESRSREFFSDQDSFSRERDPPALFAHAAGPYFRDPDPPCGMPGSCLVSAAITRRTRTVIGIRHNGERLLSSGGIFSEQFVPLHAKVSVIIKTDTKSLTCRMGLL